MRKLIFLFSMAALFFTASVCVADVSGTWVLKYTGHSGDERVLDMVITAAGNDLKVAMTHPSLGEMEGTGTLSGNKIVMTVTATGEQKVGFELKGTVEGDTMSGTREVKMPDDAMEGPQGGGNSDAQRGPRNDASGGDKSGVQRSSRGDASEGASSGAQRGPRSEASGGEQSGAQRGTPPGFGNSQEGGASGAPGGAPGSGQMNAEKVSSDWTAVKKSE